MRRIAFLLALFWFVALSNSIGEQPERAPNAEPAVSRKRFADFGFLPPPSEYTGRVFRLSQDYPPEMPTDIPEICRTGFKNDAKDWQHWEQYMLKVRDYCFEGNVHPDGDVADDWVTQDNTVRRWYHMPWQHYGPNGREGIHGLTKEAPVQPQQLAWTQLYTGGQTYAVGLFNDFGGYTIGQVWQDHEHPDAKQSKFPVGTVICKVLFVDVPPKQVPSLLNPVRWEGYITANYAGTKRSIRKLSLIQMDIALRHEEAPFGWMFGTFQYNGALNAKNPWENLVPVGMQWGNDPQVADNIANSQPVKTIINADLKETIVNPGPDLPPTHLGWNGRLNGPVDNPMSSCMSCHATAEVPQTSPISPLFQPNPPPPGSKAWMRWFANYRCTERFDKDKPTESTDFSLQMSQALQNFRDWRNAGKGLTAERYKHSPVPAKTQEVSPTQFTDDQHDEDEVFKVRRDFEEK